MFNFGKFVTFAAFEKAGRTYVADVAERTASAAQIALFHAAFNAVDNAKLSPTDVAEMAISGLGVTDATAQQYRSLIKGAITHGRKVAILPTWDESVSERDKLAKCADFVAKNSLRKLYDAYRAPTVVKQSESRDKREQETADAKAELAAAIGAPAVSDFFGRLDKAFKSAMAAADGGDATARAILSAYAARILAARDVWNAASDADADTQPAAATGTNG